MDRRPKTLAVADTSPGKITPKTTKAAIKKEIIMAQDTWCVTDLIDTPPSTSCYHQWQATMNAIYFSADGVEKYILSWEALDRKSVV